MSGSIVIIPDDPSLAVFVPDIVTAEVHDLSSTVATYAVENGSEISDHIVDNRKIFTCTIGFTNQPIETTFQGEGVRAPIELTYLPLAPPSLALFKPGPSPHVTLMSVLQFLQPTDRIRRAYDQLNALRLNRSLVTVETTRWEYVSMKLSKINETKTAEHYAGLALTFEEIKIVSTETVAAPVPREPRALPTVDKGAQAPDPFDKLIPPWLKEKNGKSISAKLADHFNIGL